MLPWKHRASTVEGENQKRSHSFDCKKMTVIVPVVNINTYDVFSLY